MVVRVDDGDCVRPWPNWYLLRSNLAQQANEIGLHFLER